MPLPNLGPVPSLNSTFAHVHNYWSFIECTKKIAAAGVHNYVRAEGKGSNVQRSRKRLKFENVLTVVPLLFLACTRIASLTDYSASKVAKIVVRHKIVSVSVEGYVSQKSSTPEKPKGKFFPWLETPQRSPHLAVKRLDRLRSDTALHKVCRHFLPLLHYKWYPGTGFFILVLCGVSIHVFVLVRVQAKNSNGTTVRMFSNFNLLCGRCTLLPFPSLLHHYAFLTAV